MTTRTLLFGLVVALAAGLVVGAGEWVAALVAVAIGGLLILHLRDADRIDALERRADDLEERLRLGTMVAEPSTSPPLSSSDVAARDIADAPIEIIPTPTRRDPAPRRAVRSARARRAAPRPTVRARAVRRSILADLPPPIRRAWDFATGGNPVARVGLLVLFVGIGLAIRYAVDVGWLGVEIRLGLAALAGAGLIALGWRLRRGTSGFGLTLQGGGVAVLYLTVYAAYALYALVPSLVAIALMAAVSILCGALAVVQNAPGLAVLGVTGGFAAPVLAGTDAGNHVLLFSYYALLNLGVLGVAWTKGWRSVAVVGFVSTFITGGLWGGLAYVPALYGSVQPFVILSFAVYLALAVRFALRSARRVEGAETPERAVVVDGGLVFGLPAATFVLQAGLIEGVVPYGRAWSAAALAAVYLVGFVLLRKRPGIRLLSDAFLAIGLTFATLALPLAFERVVVGAMWVLEGAGLVWVGARQRKAWMQWGGVALQGVAAAVLFGEGVLEPSSTFTAESLTGWVVAIGLGLSAYVLRGRAAEILAQPPSLADEARAESSLRRALGIRTAERPRTASLEGLASRVLLGFALFWWTVTAGVHVLDLAAERHVLAAMLGVAAASGALFLGLGRVLGWSGLRAAAFGVVPATGLLWMAAFATDTTPLAEWRWAGWIAVFAVIAVALATEQSHSLRRTAFVAAAWLAPTVLAWILWWGIDRSSEGAWALGVIGAVLVAALAVASRLPHAVTSDRERWTSAVGLLGAASVWLIVSWSEPGVATPLPTIPVLNPLGLPALGLLFTIGALRAVAPERVRGALAVLLSAAGFGALTVAVLRGVHAAGGSAWNQSALWASSSVQAGLAVAWTLLALALTVWAVRAESRALWFFGVAVLGLVVVKLFVVDLSQAEALVRIAAFLIVGVLGLLIGYRAPLPPMAEGGEPDGVQEGGGVEA